MCRKACGFMRENKGGGFLIEPACMLGGILEKRGGATIIFYEEGPSCQDVKNWLKLSQQIKDRGERILRRVPKYLALRQEGI